MKRHNHIAQVTVWLPVDLGDRLACVLSARLAADSYSPALMGCGTELCPARPATCDDLQCTTGCGMAGMCDTGDALQLPVLPHDLNSSSTQHTR
jgi:hypothetical protein